MGILSLIIFLPLVFSLFILTFPAQWKSVFRYMALSAVLIQVVLALFLFSTFNKTLSQPVNSESAFQFAEKVDWINLNIGSLGQLDIDYFVAVDGLSVGLLLLSAIVFLIATLSSWEIEKNVKGYFALFLLLNSAIMGVFCALDFFLFYIFYELMLLPLYFLIGMWGGARREYAAIKFFLYTLFGSVFMLLVIVGLYFSVSDPVTGHHTFNIISMFSPGNYVGDAIFSIDSSNALLFGYPARLLAFIVLFVAFAIKVPVVPLHTWLPDAHVEAPTPISIILAGLLLKVGGYGIIRICYGIFPEGALHFSWWIGLLGVISIIYGAMNALAQKDLKRLIAYSSVSHMGFVLLGFASLTPEGISGAIMQLFSHGILSAMLFFIAGIIYSRVHNREIVNFSGLASHMPRYTTFVTIAFFASLGLPGFSAFIGEAFVLIGSFNSANVNQLLPRWMAVVATGGVLLGAGYFLWALQRMFFGELKLKEQNWKEKLNDMTWMERLTLFPLALLTLLLGVFPSLVFDVLNNSVNRTIEFVGETGFQTLTTLKTLFLF